MSHHSLGKGSDDPIFNGDWVREATLLEDALNVCNHYGGILIWYQLNLKSKDLVKEHHILKALNHLYRKCPNLSLCTGTKDGKTWLRKATNPEVDFKVLQGGSLAEVRKSLQSYEHQFETGPLFVSRLLLDPVDAEIFPDDDDPDMKYKSYILFGFAHCITDGTSNMHIMGFFLSLLNDVISGKPINDEEPLGTLASPDQTQTLIKKRVELIEGDQDLKDQLAQEIGKFEEVTPCIVKVSGTVNEEKDTINIYKIFDRNTTSVFIQKCKENKVTVNSGLSATANAALIDLLVENGIIQDSYQIQSFHEVNLRRYWETTIEQGLGTHISYPLPIYKDTPKNIDKQFWDYTRSLHQEIKEDLDSGKVLLIQAFDALTHFFLPLTEERMLAPKKYTSDYVTSNLGDVTSKVTDRGDYVRASHLLRVSTMHLNEFPIEMGCHTFRGKLTMIFSYNKGAVSKEVMERFSDLFFNRIENIIKMV